MNTPTNTARITNPNNPPHYIAMAGLRGYMPNYCDVYASKTDAVDGLIQLHDLYDDEIDHDRIVELRDSGWCDLDIDEHGNEYAEVTECDCDDPGIHSDDMYIPPSRWYAENDPDYALRQIENAIPDNSTFWSKIEREMFLQFRANDKANDEVRGHQYDPRNDRYPRNYWLNILARYERRNIEDNKLNKLPSAQSVIEFYAERYA